MFTDLRIPPRPAPAIPAIPPFRVECFCPKVSQTWQAAESGRTFNNWSAAVNLAHVLKSPRGQARVIDATGRVVYLI